MVTCVDMSVASPHHVAELLAAGALAESSRAEAQLLHQHQRLLAHIFFPIPRHPPICIALLTPNCAAAQPAHTNRTGTERKILGHSSLFFFI